MRGIPRLFLASLAQSLVVEPRKALVQNVSKLRQRTGMTQVMLADRAPMNRRFLQQIEAGEASPTIDTLVKIKRTLCCSWEELLEHVE
ncbi:MAG: helix-turn-helix transcriptional regulator [Verrucomicrobiota bacterium]